jgi:Leucine rich repeat
MSSIHIHKHITSPHEEMDEDYDPSPRLPTGEVITAKNTLQSFVDTEERPHDGRASASGIRSTSKNNTSNNNDRTQVPIVIANLIPDFPSAEAQIIPNVNTIENSPRPDPPELSQRSSQQETLGRSEPCITSPSNEQNSQPDQLFSQRDQPSSQSRRNTARRLRWWWWLVGIVVISVIGGGVGGYCASSGKCGGGSGSSADGTGDDASKNVTVADNVTSFINSISLSGRSITSAGTTPEDRALQWLIDEYVVPLTATNRSIDELHLIQRYALSALWFQGQEANKLRRLDPLELNSTFNWLNGDGECTWSGVVCNADNAVINITLPPSTLQRGTIPPDLVLLSGLMHLDLAENNLRGSIPSEIGRLTDLQHFYVKENSISGTLPMSMTSWTKIETLDLQENKITGTVPQWMGLLTTLTYLDLGNNVFNGTVPYDLGRLNSLRYVYLKDNFLTGSIPSSFARWINLEYFGFSRNELTGTLPDFIGRWTNILYFAISINQLTGTIPETIGAWSLIQRAFLYDNFFTGTVPIGICNYSSSFKNLSADCNSEVTCSCCTNCY